MAAISERDLQAIKNRADIVDVVGQYIPVQKKGKEYTAVCPFHEDHDPSLHISQDKQIYKCFVCGAGGDAFRFVEQMEKIPFVQAVQKVADLVHYPLQISAPAQSRPANPDQPLYDALKTFEEYGVYELNSTDGLAAMEYLRTRQFSEQLLKKFSIGYAPSRKLGTQFLQARFPDRSVLESTGLIYGNQEQLAPFFANRILIPIANASGQTVGFSARRMPGDDNGPKYINTPASALYQKGELIFNYHRVIKTARSAGRAILTEGAMDVLGLEKAGIEEGLACLGTACTREQMQMLLRLQVPVVVFYDQDQAGRDATWKFGLMALEAGLPFSIVMQEEAKDPDEIFCSKGKQALQAVLSHTVSLVEFSFTYLKSKYDLDNYDDKKTYGKTIYDLIQRSLEDFEKPAAVQKLEEITGFTFKPGNQRKKKKERVLLSRPLDPVESGRLKAEKTILRAMLENEQFAIDFRHRLNFFLDPDCRQLSLYIYQAYRAQEGPIQSEDLYQCIEEESVQNLLVEIDNAPEWSIENLERGYFDALYRIESSMIEQNIALINEKIGESDDMKEKIQLLQDKSKLKTQLMELQQQYIQMK